MADVLSSGQDPDQRRRHSPRRGLVLVAVLLTAAAAVASYAANHRHAGSHPPSASPAAAATAALPPVHVAKTDPVPPSWLRCGQHCDVPVLHAPAGQGPRGLRLLINTNPATVLDGTGRTHRGPSVPLRRGEHIDTLLPMGAETAALVSADNPTKKSPRPRIYRIGVDGSVALIGRADAIVQGIGATLWTITYPPQSASLGSSEPAPYRLTEIDRTGRVLARHAEPENVYIFRATNAGLLAAIATSSDGSYLGQTESVRLLDPATGQLGSQLGDGVFAVLDATDNLVAWSSSRRPVVEIYDLNRGTAVGSFDAPGYHPPDYGRFSPDQRTLVLGFSDLVQLGTNPASYGYLESLDLSTRRITRINGLLTPPKNDPQLDWSHDSRTLILGVDDGKAAHIALWERQRPGLVVLPKVISHSAYTQLTYLPRDGS